MAHSSSIFSRVPIELPNRSGFDMSHENLGTATCGTLVPVLCDELLPNDTVSLGTNFQVQLPPMSSDFYGRVDFVLEAFFVPARLLWGGWQSFMTHPTSQPQYPEGMPVEGKSRFVPQVKIPITGIGPSTLSDYLGLKSFSAQDQTTKLATVNALPFLAYHRIYDDWYRDSRIQSPLFFRPLPSMQSSPDVSNPEGNIGNSVKRERMSVANVPYFSGGVDIPIEIIDKQVGTPFVGDQIDMTFPDGVKLTELRQRNFSKDYYTSASPLPQAGKPSELEFEVDTTAKSGKFSIADLRAANSLQKWMERNNIAGYRYSDQIYAQYGIYPSDAIMNKCVYLGRHIQNVYTRSVFQTATPQKSEIAAYNGFNTVGSKFGSSQAIGEGSLIDNFRVTEHGFLVVLASLVPHAYYSTGSRRYLRRSVVGDYAFPLLSGMGDQAIFKSELTSNAVDANEVFGYTDLYAEYKYHDDEVHGLLRDGSNLSGFALQRSFEDSPDLSSSFLQIPTDYLDQVFVANQRISGFSCWYDIYFPYKKISTLPEYSLPTLADLKHVHTGYLSRGGKRL